ncbi:MAG: hypothetical protein VW270_02750, partial [Candidatus Poseidoniales archaeon]
MADYPSEDKQEELIEEFKEQYPSKWSWAKANPDTITQHYESPWDLAVSAVVEGGGATSRYDRLASVVTVDNGFTEQQVLRLGAYAGDDSVAGDGGEIADPEGYISAWVKPDIEGYNDNVAFLDILEYEYEKAQMNHVFEAEGGVGQVLTD